MKSKYLVLKGMTEGRQELTFEFGKIGDIDTDEFHLLIADEELQDKLCYKIEKVLGFHKSQKCWIIESLVDDYTFVTTDKKIAKEYKGKQTPGGFWKYQVTKSKIK